MHTQEQVIGGIRIEDTGVPIYVQLREQILRAMGAGVLKPGDQMPTMRQVAVALRVDLNTVRRAYDELERLGTLRLERGRGSFVARPPAPASPKVQDAAADKLARQTLAQAAALGVAPALLIEKLAAFAAEKETKR
ncbi:MAG: GntR family transcriptional regulator [Phenylobacterium sp.]|uniref:GntR family transcriptional regulator n=1 Tax=Phenylobacterium sp. TaxID=1871053 RepID=UPI0025CE6A3C|nr:GntR family transcriptional regulator [Phenylobacterium sp.]MBI1199291.1 GntR family transcriptional regulator [Phenylobacterium sp.]